MEKVKIAVLSCLKATGVCSGAACFRAINNREKHFNIYKDMDVEVVAFFHCNGCDCDYSSDVEYLEKIEYVCSLEPDAVHVGKCTCMEGNLCTVIEAMVKYIEDRGMKVIFGTH